jgi:DNA-binding transcriptional regulator YdaS (Cro superfamily)
VIPTLIIQNATLNQAISINQAVSINQATSINQAVSIKQATLIKHAISKHAISVNQISYASASHFLNVSVIQSINIWSVIHHLIDCLVVIISTLSAREID